MAKNFGSAGSAKSFENVAKASAERAQVIVVKMISNDRLLDYPKNHEDVQDTADLENSIKELGFTDPIEVTAFGQAEECQRYVCCVYDGRIPSAACGSAGPCFTDRFRQSASYGDGV